MNGPHDIGGMDGFGPVEPEPEDKPPFKAPWEGRVHAMTRAMGAAGAWNMDEGRFAIERILPHVYLAATYYQKWQLRNERLCRELGLVSPEELAAGHASEKGPPLPQPALAPEAVDTVMTRGTFAREVTRPARFAPGDKVRARNIHPASHTRLPRFVRGHVGTVERIQGFHVYPDSNVAAGEEDPQWLYTVVFDGQMLWGDDAEPLLEVSVDAFEPYLEPA
jgi:nitrile hydratase beta subunit